MPNESAQERPIVPKSRRNATSAFSFLLNLLWILFGGLWMAAGWGIAAIFMAITIIGLPWMRAAFNIAAYTLLPFGQKVVSRAVYFGREDIGTGQKKASRLELSVRRLAASAAKCDIGSAAWLLKLRAHAEKYRDAGPTIITIIGGLPPMRSTKADRCAGDRSASDAGQECAGSSAPVPGEHGDSGPTIIRVAGGFPDAFR